jgi:uncharacterized phage-associated protein
MTVSARAVANELLDVAEDVRSSIDPLQLQKLLYLAQGWTLGLSGDPLFLEPIEAWAYGPVVPEIHHSVKMFGASPIRGRLLTIDRVRRRVIVAHERLDEFESDVLKAVWEKYGSWSGAKLISLTHQGGSPWWRARHSGEYNARISHGVMTDWFAEEAEKASLLNYP